MRIRHFTLMRIRIQLPKFLRIHSEQDLCNPDQGDWVSKYLSSRGKNTSTCTFYVVAYRNQCKTVKKLIIYFLYLDTLGIQSILGHNLDQLREVVGVPTSRRTMKQPGTSPAMYLLVKNLFGRIKANTRNGLAGKSTIENSYWSLSSRG